MLLPRRQGMDSAHLMREATALTRRPPLPYSRWGWRQLHRPERQLEEPPAARSVGLATRLVLLLMALYVCTFTAIAFLEHDAFRTNAFDLGNMDQAMWNTAHGRPFQFTNWEGASTRLAIHVEPIFLALAPLYGIWSSPKLLLLLQTAAVALGALPVAWLAREKTGSEAAAVAFAGAYLLSPGLEAANLADFHPVTLAAPLLLWAFYALLRGWSLLCLLVAVLAMTTKEHVPLTVGLFGWYAWRSGRRWLGGVLGASAAVWFIVAVFVVIPMHNPSGASPYWERYAWLGNTPAEMALNVVRHPGSVLSVLVAADRLEYLRALVAPVAYLPLLSPASLLFSLPDIAINVLSDYADQRGFAAHYSALPGALMVLAAVLGAGVLVKVARALFAPWGYGLAKVLGALVLGASTMGALHYVWAPLLDHPPRVTDHERRAQGLMALVPRDAPLTTTSGLNPHMSQRQQVYLFPRTDNAEFVLLDVTANPYPLDVPSQWWNVQVLLAEDWGVRAAEDGYLLLQRGWPVKEVPASFYSFVRADERQEMVPLAVSWNSIRLLGYRLEPGPRLRGWDPYVNVQLFFTVDEPFEGDARIVVALRAPDGSLAEAKWDSPTTQWYPVNRWQPGEVVQVSVGRLSLGALENAELLLGIALGKAPQDSAMYLAPRELADDRDAGDNFVRLAILERR